MLSCLEICILVENLMRWYSVHGGRTSVPVFVSFIHVLLHGWTLALSSHSSGLLSACYGDNYETSNSIKLAAGDRVRPMFYLKKHSYDWFLLPLNINGHN